MLELAATVWQRPVSLRAPTQMMRRTLIAVFGILPWLGCAHGSGAAAPCENPPPFYVTLEGASHLNPDARGRSLPTTVELYQLKGTSKLERLEFARLQDKPQELLGEDLVKVDEMTVDPGQSISQWLTRDPKATALLAAAWVRQPSGNSWRQLVALPPPDSCSAPPKTASAAPQSGDVQVKFYLEDFEIRAQRNERSVQ